MVCGLVYHACLVVAGSGPLTADLARTHDGLKVRVTTDRDYDRLMAVFQ